MLFTTGIRQPLLISLILSVIIGVYLISSVSSHGHEHGHSHEPPASKYSKEANEGHGHLHGAHSHGAHGHSHGPSGDKTQEKVPKTAIKATGMMLWLQALGATFLISISPVFILLFIPIDKSTDKEHQPLLKVLLAFASGGLLGDAFLHLIPHAVSPHSHGGDDHSHSHDHGHSHGEEGHSHDMSIGLWVLAGIVAFLVVEKFVRCIKGGHSHSHAAPKPAASKSTKKDESKTDKKTDKSAPKGEN